MRGVLEGELRQRRSLHVRYADGVERDVDPARACGDRVGVLVDGSLVEGVHVRCLGPASCGGNLVRYPVELVPVAPAGQEVAAEVVSLRTAAHR
jgi:hypothetical protein